MKFKLFENQIQYNANPYDKNEGDCTIRALSLAYDMQYNLVKSELRSIGNKLNRDFNGIEAIKAFIEKHKYKNFYNNEHDNDLSIGTVEDFANKNRHGTYIVYCSNSTKQNTSKSFHLVAVINGDIYDTWDSSNYYVLGAWAVNTSATKLVNKVNDQNS